MNDRLIFTFFTMHGREVQAYAMVSSIRAFAGAFKEAPIWIMVPEGAELQGDLLDKFKVLDVTFHSIPNHPAIAAFPYASKPIASAAAESLAVGKTDFLVWIDRDGLMTGEPDALLLPKGKFLGYRPTDMRNIGSPWGEPLSPFWSEIYSRFEIPVEKAFPFTSVVDEQTMYPYVNAGLLCVRPEAGILRQWRDDFLAHYQDKVWKPFQKESAIYYWLLHQVLLTGTVMKMLNKEQMELLPWGYNYPANLHHRFAKDKAAAALDEVTSIRIDDLLSHEGWWERFSADDPILNWLEELLSEYGSYYDVEKISPECV